MQHAIEKFLYATEAPAGMDLVKVSVCAINFFWACINYAINQCITIDNDLNVYKISNNDFF